ncbi:zinc-binding dehydrogenase, partial [Chloroflexota bacterium]
MKAVILVKPGVLEVQEVPNPTVGRNEVKIKVMRAGICGSDVNVYRNGSRRTRYPLIRGHEFSGVVAEGGIGTELQPGQQVTVMPVVSCGECDLCRNQHKWLCPQVWLYGAAKSGGFAEEVVVADDRVYVLPDNMSLDQGAFVEPLAVVMHVLNRCNLQPEDKVAILGAGSIGMLTIQEVA